MSQQCPSNCARLLAYLVATMLFATHLANASSQIDVDADLKHMLGRCHRVNEDFNECMRQVFNDLRAYFTTGVPDYNIKPFDPHHCGYVELRRGDSQGLGSFRLILRNVSEYGWARSEVTKFHADPEDHRIVYTQYFPDKSLEGEYEFAAKMLGTEMNRRGHWNLTLYDYSQTTSVRRIGGPGSLIKVHVEVDRIGGMELHIENLLQGQPLNQLADGVINSMWQLGLPFIKPMINELVSTAFTDIFNESFRHFPLEKFLAA
ncbi:circadian clock-controlled protein daywake [Drosophila teissieri]|uniref:circadian clock-controlled protein daywake n=1 Tax=Drosophila teissieri TaxID=7243 RepID=UPI001CB9ECCC|nr:circadian clock-controlled protein daywake [Drosophila teissieri]XP_043654930.1 circadian clock-controlled protein daywake [Drosophila teissieri]XP_043654931.1 circadian clock-controlled protein daywake [Drosophila teissieri]